MASIEAAFGIGAISKAKEDWVLATTARIGDKLRGYLGLTMDMMNQPDKVLLYFLQSDRQCTLTWYEGNSFYETERACGVYPTTLTLTSDSTLHYTALANNPVMHYCWKVE